MDNTDNKDAISELTNLVESLRTKGTQYLTQAIQQANDRIASAEAKLKEAAEKETKLSEWEQTIKTREQEVIKQVEELGADRALLEKEKEGLREKSLILENKAKEIAEEKMRISRILN